jgi:hypothetical protein
VLAASEQIEVNGLPGPASLPLLNDPLHDLLLLWIRDLDSVSLGAAQHGSAQGHMSVLNYESRVTKPSAFEDEMPKPKVSAEEVKLTREFFYCLPQSPY